MEDLILHNDRRYLGPEYTIGDFRVGDEDILCNILEPPCREQKDLNGDGDFTDPGEGKIPDHTAILPGLYEIDLITWDKPKVPREVCILKNVYGYSGILIHSGATVVDTHACMIPGLNNVKGMVTQSRKYEAIITSIVREAKNQGRKVFIKVTQPS